VLLFCYSENENVGVITGSKVLAYKYLKVPFSCDVVQHLLFCLLPRRMMLSGCYINLYFVGQSYMNVTLHEKQARCCFFVIIISETPMNASSIISFLHTLSQSPNSVSKETMMS
jgi:hypothetical protein